MYHVVTNYHVAANCDGDSIVLVINSIELCLYNSIMDWIVNDSDEDERLERTLCLSV